MARRARSGSGSATSSFIGAARSARRVRIGLSAIRTGPVHLRSPSAHPTAYAAGRVERCDRGGPVCPLSAHSAPDGLGDGRHRGVEMVPAPLSGRDKFEFS